MGTAVRKVRGGKLLRVRVEHDGSAISEVVITGDFFLHPEEGLVSLERGLVGAPLHEGDRRLAMRIEAILAENRVTVLGFGPSDLAEVMREAGA